MSEIKNIAFDVNKAKTYSLIYKQIEALIEYESSEVANLANLTSLIHFAFNHLWTGYYKLEDNSLILQNFQGPVACTRIEMGKGVCGKAAKSKNTIIVPDVSKFDDHIACSALSKSEIVIPVIKDSILLGVFDIDSESLNSFNEVDKLALGELLGLVFN